MCRVAEITDGQASMDRVHSLVAMEEIVLMVMVCRGKTISEEVWPVGGEMDGDDSKKCPFEGKKCSQLTMNRGVGDAPTSIMK